MRHPASFRDPDSFVVVEDRRILRYFTGSAVDDAHEAIRIGLFDRLAEQRAILPVETVTTPAGERALVLAQEALPFVSYPYEWPFSMLKAAALLHLDILDSALRSGFTLTDGSAYNVQFLGPKPVFIDLGSFRKHVEGKTWNGYAQFCRHFLYPLLLSSYTGVSHHPFLRAALDGIPLEQVRALLPLRAKVRPAVFGHVVLQSLLREREIDHDAELRKASSLPSRALLRLVAGLRRTIEGLRPPTARSRWVTYEHATTYTDEAARAKMAIVQRAAEDTRARQLWDLGCNVGTYTIPLAAPERSVVGMDADADAVEVLFRRATGSPAPVLPLVMDITNPSPSQGWAQRERQGLAERGPADLVIALALMHHLRFGGGIPVREFVRWLASVASNAVIEFVPRSDPMVRRLLAWRDAQSGPDYSEETLDSAVTQDFTTISRHPLSGSERVVYVVAGSRIAS